MIYLRVEKKDRISTRNTFLNATCRGKKLAIDLDAFTQIVDHIDVHYPKDDEPEASDDDEESQEDDEADEDEESEFPDGDDDEYESSDDESEEDEDEEYVDYDV